MTMKEQTMPILEERLNTLYQLASNESLGEERWIQVNADIIALVASNDFSNSDIAQCILLSKRFHWMHEKDGNVRDCAFSVLGGLNPNLVKYEDAVLAIKAASASMLCDQHIFAAGRAADLIRLWRDIPQLKPEADKKLKSFKNRADQTQYTTEATWLMQYKEDIPMLFEYLQNL